MKKLKIESYTDKTSYLHIEADHNSSDFFRNIPNGRDNFITDSSILNKMKIEIAGVQHSLKYDDSVRVIINTKNDEVTFLINTDLGLGRFLAATNRNELIKNLRG